MQGGDKPLLYLLGGSPVRTCLCVGGGEGGEQQMLADLLLPLPLHPWAGKKMWLV